MLGRHHPLLRRVRALRRDAKLRRREGVFVAEGPHLAQAALEASWPIEAVLYSARILRDPAGADLLRHLERAAARCDEVSDSSLDALQDARSPQPLMVITPRRPPRPISLEDEATVCPLAVVAYGIQDPGNLGSLLRTAEAAGATAFFVSGRSADLYHPRTARASAGAIFRLPAWEASFRRLLERLRAEGLVVLGTAPSVGEPYHALDARRPLAVCFGGEAAGIPGDLRRLLDGTVRIPMRPGVESLSVGAAAAVILFEAARRRAAAD